MARVYRITETDRPVAVGSKEDNRPVAVDTDGTHATGAGTAGISGTRHVASCGSTCHAVVA